MRGTAAAQRPRPFGSLRWRIAAYYVALIIVLVAILGFLEFRQVRNILLDETRAHIDLTGNDVARVAEQSNPLGPVGDMLPIIEQLAAPGNLDHWSSPSTFIEIDSSEGDPIGKSSNSDFLNMSGVMPGDQQAVYHMLTVGKGELLVRTQRVTTSDGKLIVVHVAERLDLVDETLDHIRTLLIFATGFAIVAVVLSASSLAARAVAPIDELTKAISAIGSDQLDRRVSRKGRTDEVGLLAEAFDALLARLEEAFARERQFISDASHELKTPLTVINANAQMLERWADSDPQILRDSLRAIVDESAGLARMVNGLLLLAKAESGDDIPHEPVELAEVVRAVALATQARAQAKGLTLNLEVPADGQALIISGNANLLRQLGTNLVENAMKFTDHGSVTIRTFADGNRAIIEVTDTGVGIEEEELTRIFDRFYRTDRAHSRAREGTGLGLAIVRSIARVHDGSVTAHRNTAGGTTFRVGLPL
ncbi:MAG TPA: HAMP domain-containing sensor histidine kinase [Candidatus Baltobacteraceae bacterium]|jgi:signal transduction histidine kinase|nr:HAMP domain-containing sensor histidine kinase [Candidatus Baltobacteraceae bacterium]